MIYTEHAYAKINLYLNILSRREDGYHDLQTVMQTVSLADGIALEFPENGEGITLSSTDATLPTDDSNIVSRAISAYYEAAGKEIPAISVAIDKKIPIGAGLAGGSADAAAVLRILNKAAEEPLDDAALLEAAAKVGADVPFCLRGGTAYCQGIGEIMTVCPSLPACQIVVAVPDEAISTAEAYASLDKQYADVFPDTKDKYEAMMLSIADKNLDGITANLYNVFEETTVSYSKKVKEIRRILGDLGAAGISLSGSGPAVFGIFSDERKASVAASVLSAFGYKAFRTVPIKP